VKFNGHVYGEWVPLSIWGYLLVIIISKLDCNPEQN